MIGGGTSVFGDPDDFEAGLSVIGGVDLLALGHDAFRARMTQIVLPRLRLSAVEEFQRRLAFVSLLAGTVRVCLPIAGGSARVYGGRRVDTGALVTHRAGLGVHERIDGPCHWGDIVLPVAHLDRYGRALTGSLFSLLPGVRYWRPPAAALNRLTALYTAAIHVIVARPGLPAGREAAHGLEQQLTEALIECLSRAPLPAQSAPLRRQQQLLDRFEAVRRDRQDVRLSVREIATALGVSDRSLRLCFRRHLDIAPDRYLRARRLQAVRRALRRSDPGETSVSQIARLYGFRELGRFAASYREHFGELPSATLKG